MPTSVVMEVQKAVKPGVFAVHDDNYYGKVNNAH
jgi:hypothetical protein